MSLRLISAMGMALCLLVVLQELYTGRTMVRTYIAFAVVFNVAFHLSLSPETRWANWLAVLGSVMNYSAVALNGWQMPVLARGVVPSRWWKPLDESTRAYWLCDIWWGFSLGDFLILISIPLLIVVSVMKMSVLGGHP